MRRKNRAVCGAQGCNTVPRVDPLYCHEHRHLRLVDDAKHASREQVLKARIEASEAEARAWVKGQGPVEESATQMLRSIESNAERSREGAVGAFRAASALNKNLEQHEERIVAHAVDRFGKGKLPASDGTFVEIGHARTRTDWDTTALLDTVDSTVPEGASMAEYVAALRSHTSSQYRPHRISEALPGLKPEDVYQSVHDGPMGLRPLDPERDAEVFGNDLEREQWEQAWAEEMNYSNPADLPEPTHDHSPQETADMIRDVQQAREKVRRALVDQWAPRATASAKPGDVVRDSYGVMGGVVTSGWECHGPQHNVVNAALEAMPDRRSARAAYEKLARITGKLRPIKAAGVDPDELSVKTEGKLRARAIAA